MQERSKRIRRARGAAMVEGIVVMGVMLVFLGMNLWAFKAYGGKIDQAASVRRDALYFASHSCETKNASDPDTYTVDALKGTAASGGKTSFSLMGLIASVRGKGTEDFDLLATARSKKGPVAIRGTAITSVGASGVEKSALETRVQTEAAVGCNEKPLGNGIPALLRAGWNALKSLVTG
jgi:hypothetical protein